MKKYTFEIIIEEENNEFWESIADKPGVEEVLAMVTDMFGSFGFWDKDNISIRLKNYRED